MENPETPVRILVVDDEPDIRNILHILLSSRGYEVDEAENGLRAVELVGRITKIPELLRAYNVQH